MEFDFDWEENEEKIKELRIFMKENRYEKGILMPVLFETQDLFGYIPIEMQELISKELRIPLAEIYGVVTFYSMFSLTPKGEYDIGVCLGTACYVRGAQQLLDKVEEELGIKVGETTADRKFSISETTCVGVCGLAPVVLVNDEVHGGLTPGEMKEFLDGFR